MNTLNKFNYELNKRMKAMMAEGIFPKSMMWVLGKLKITEDLGKELKVNVMFPSLLRYEYKQRENWWGFFKTLLGIFIYKTGLIRNLRIIHFLDYFAKMPMVFFPTWIYQMDGHKLLINERDLPMREILKDYTLLKIWEPETTKIVKEQVQEGNICVDIGASIGYFTLLFARQAGETGKVFSFEPTEMNFNYMCENIKLNGYENIVKPYKMAAWDKEELVKMPLNASNPVWVNGIAVSDILEQQGIIKVDFIKVDVDGAEPKVLKGLEKIFQNNPHLKMVIEYYPKYIQDAGLSPEEFMEILTRYFTWSVIPGDYSDNCWNFYCERKQ